MRVTFSRVRLQDRLIASGILLAGALAAAILSTPLGSEVFQLVRPRFCLLKCLTGVPCLACRGTRAALALFQGDLRGALWMNPLATVFIAGLLLYFTQLSLTGRRPVLQISPRESAFSWIALICALFGNWAYVIYRGG